MTMTYGPLVGIVTGLVSAVLFASVSSGTALGVMVLFFLAPLPIVIAGLGWGATAGFFAAATGTIIMAFLGANASAAIFYAFTIALPMAAACYLLMLSRQVQAADPGKTIVLEWFPIGRLVAYAAIWAALLATLAILSTGLDLEGLRHSMLQTFESMIAQGGPLAPTMKRPLTPQEKNDFVSLMLATMPGALATLWLVIALINVWLAGQVTRISGMLLRPWPDFAALSLPPQMPFVFAAAILATFLGGITGLIGSAFAFAIMMAYVMVGLAIIHHVTRGNGLRPGILAATYLSLVLLNPFSTFIVALIGLTEPVSPLRRQPRPPPGSAEN